MKELLIWATGVPSLFSSPLTCLQ